MAKVTNKVVVVTGGSRGIGLQFVKTLLEQGNIVVATARNPANAAGLQELTKQYGDRLIPSALEASSEESIAQWAAGLQGKIKHIDVLINNAGAAFETYQHGLKDINPKVLSDTFAINTYGPILIAKYLLQEGLLGGESPSLVAYTSSLMASMGGFAFPTAKMFAYRASKSALNMLVLTSIEEMTAHNITSVLLHPGYVATDMTQGHEGTISVTESIEGQLKVLEDGRPLNGKFYSYTGEELLF